ncbi:MAG: TRAP transporter small permease subunit, partial [Pseudomonadota bacterium]
MNTFVDWVDRINETVGQAVKWLAVFMVLVTMLVVVLRYGFNVGAIALQESVMYMHGILFLLGIPYALKHGAHVRVDILYTRLQP